MAKAKKQDQQEDVVELTQEGLDEIKAELNELKNVKLPAIIDRVARAREYGDLSENSEYHNARDEQQLIEARIDEIEEIIVKARIVKQTRSHQKIGIGSEAVIYQKEKKSKKHTVKLVGEFEADPKNWKVSSVSPLGKALIGRKKGDEVTVEAPAGERTYVVEKIK